ncbi:mismatch-specific DNA-glycosylase [Bacillus methanolicus]|uniref:G/U mismatch-specific DNA glycosylase n=1 Tax=Bacillus methanolicus (strain MGA3 / ATCC 53907) TaxID=796606 RepID=I3E8D0_BACMM|nr:mismatch-specific DNA-glycosylase [Bacillus methanolicus]AIE60023.1 G/U mismatch-specific DNA glycosylase [Bacillus methanolicus MGA3]EIJ82751.1 mismatch-specific thymine-DNA glycosylate (mug) family protein [Bacillus methanolicus MGA3]UQD52027.1 mismatch-specific DNA-glycosylase [Bacillus methanolicus]
MNPLSDHLKENMDILFVGFNPSIRSAETGHHYANPNNRFWKILYEACITPRKYKSEEDYKLLDLGYGLTNIVARPTKAANEITKEEYKEGREKLKKKIEFYKPKIVCFVGKRVYLEFSGKRDVHWGLQDEPIVPGTIDFVAPSSSGLVRMKMAEVINIYKKLTDLLSSIQSAVEHGKGDR